MSYEVGCDLRKEFYRQSQGEFISVLRLKRQFGQKDVAEFLQVTAADVEKIEQGETRLEDRDFFKLCAHLGGANEVSVFIEKMEKAMTPGLRQARRDIGKFMWIYGVTFADEEKPT